MSTPVMDPAVILISDDEDDVGYERNINQQDDVVLISSDEDDDYDEDNGNQLEDNAVKKANQGSNDLPKLSFDECKLYLRKYGIRLCGTKEECMQRVIEHARLVDGEGVSLYPRSSFSINCTGDACKGDIVMFKLNILNSRRKIVGRRTVTGRIVGKSYGESDQQHIFSVEVLWSEPTKKLNPLSILVLKGFNLYKFGTFRQPWKSELERSELLREKHVCGNAARHKRKLRQTEFNSNSNKGKKRQKVSHRGPFQSKQTTQIDKHSSKRKGADSVEESTSAHKRKTVTVRLQKAKLKRLKDTRVKSSLYPRSSFSINCTGDACKGDVVLFKQKQSIKQGETVGRILTIAGRIVKECYGASRQQHTFTVEVLWTKPSLNPLPVSTMLIRGCKLYRFGTFRQPWKNEAERIEVLEEKHKRGKAARHQRKLRLAQIASINDKGGKLQKPSRNKQKTRIVKLKLSKRWGVNVAKPHKKKSTQSTLNPNLNPSLRKQPTRTKKQKFSKRRGSTLVKESKAAHKKAEQLQRTECNKSTQPVFHQDLNPNPNRSMYSDHNLQEASLSFPYNPNLNPICSMHYDHHLQEALSSFPYNPNLNPNCSMYYDHHLQKALSSFPYDPNQNRSMYSDHHLQHSSSSFPYDTTSSYCSLGYGHYNIGGWGPNNVFHQPPGRYHYNYEQLGHYQYIFEQLVSRYWFGQLL